MTDLKKQMSVGLDVSDVEAGTARGKKSLQDFATSAVGSGREAAAGVAQVGRATEDVSRKAAQAAKDVEKETRSLVQQLQRRIATEEAAGKGASARFESLARQRGADVAALKPYLAQLDAVIEKNKAAATALDSSGPALQRAGVSAAQTAAAMRMVPAQFTDIVVGLQGGQAPLTVLLQQGGQLKDMFGGIGGAARGLATYVAGLVSPLTIVAAAVAALGLAYYQASERNSAFNKALVQTGDYVGKTSAELSDLTRNVAAAGGTQGQAADAITQLAASGKIAGENLAQLSVAALALYRGVGTPIDDTVKEFVKLGEEPTKASAKLNESLHYLSLATYERIRSLEDQGRAEEAAAVAQGAYAEAAVQRMQQVQAQAGLLSRTLSGTKNIALGMWEAIAQGVGSIGARESAGEQLREAQRTLAYLQQNGSSPAAMAKAQQDVAEASRRALREQETAFAEGQRSRDESARIAASDRLKKLSDEVRSNADKRRKAIEDLNRDYKLLGKATSGEEYDKLVANINDKFKDPKEAKTKAYQDDAATKFLETQRQAEAALRGQLAGESKLTEAAREQLKFQQLIADLKDKKILTADQRSLLAAKDAIAQQLQLNAELSNQVEFEKKIEEIVRKSKEEAIEFGRQMQAINLSIADSAKNRGEQYDRTLGAFGLGNRAREEVAAQKEIYREFERYRLSATKQAAEKNQLGSDAYADELSKINQAQEDALRSQGEYHARLREKQGDWTLGAREAFANYSDSAKNVAESTRSAFERAFGGMEDAMVSFATTGKADFKGLANSIIADLIRIQVRAAMASILGDGKGGGFNLAGLFGAAVGSAAGGGGGAGITAVMGMPGATWGGGGGITAAMGMPAAAWSTGGYTGAGGKFEPAGIVHKGEYVINADSTSKIGLATLERINRYGYAAGGLVGASGPAGNGAPMALNLINQSSVPMTSDNVSFDTQTRTLIIRDAVSAAAAQWLDPNSRMRKNYERGYRAPKNRP